MNTQITITLPDEVYQRAERFAKLVNRDIPNVPASPLDWGLILSLGVLAFMRQIWKRK
jgi:hypothetical protein